MKIKFSDSSLETPGNYQGQKLNYSPAKRTFPKFKWFMILVVVLSPIVLLLGSMFWSTIQVAGEGYLESEVSTYTATADGRIEYLAPMNDSIFDSGTTVIILNKHSAAATSTATSQKELASMKNTIDIAQSLTEVRRKEYNNTKQLYKKGVISLPDLLKSQGDYISAQLQSSESEVRYYGFQRSEGARKQDVNNDMYHKYELGARGKIIARYVKNAEFVQSHKTLMVVQNYPAKYYYLVYLKPKFQKYVYVGMTLRVKHASGAVYHAKITHIDKIIQTPSSDNNLTQTLFTAERRLQVRLEPVEELPEGEQTIGSPVKTTLPFGHNIWAKWKRSLKE